MSEFIVSARKYRPETFKTVVGQENITSTLKNSIRNQHMGHAYLFCGPRGVGKTTCARIFAKTINCFNPSPETEPCNECESCLAFNESRSYNIHELDAASNNSVDDIRTLTEQVRIPPQLGKYSVYIIDEVHMLSTQAFNAFLKTLEEPPAHAVFILATTEKHKIIPTILSRCQIFDFSRIRVDDMVRYLEYIAAEEKISAGKEALHVIAQKADGAMRDALSIFDQVVSFGEGGIRYEQVIENLNVLDHEYYFRIAEYCLKSSYPEALLLFDEVLDKGFDGHNFITGLATHFRDLLVSQDSKTVELLEVSENLKARFLEQAASCQPDFLFNALDICNQADINYKSSRNQRLLIELTLLKLCRAGNEKKNDSSIEKSPESNPKTESASESHPVFSSAKPQPNIPKQESTRPLPEKKTEPATRVEKSTVKGNVISIKAVLSGKNADSASPEKEVLDSKEQMEPDEPAEVPEESFDAQQLSEAWKKYYSRLKEEMPRLYNAMSAREPEIIDGARISVVFDNTVQLDDFVHNIKQPLLNYLKRELSNHRIVLETGIDQTGEDKKKLYTAEEKFKYLNKKNPNLGKLKQEFNLDFE